MPPDLGGAFVLHSVFHFPPWLCHPGGVAQANLWYGATYMWPRTIGSPLRTTTHHYPSLENPKKSAAAPAAPRTVPLMAGHGDRSGRARAARARAFLFCIFFCKWHDNFILIGFSRCHRATFSPHGRRTRVGTSENNNRIGIRMDGSVQYSALYSGLGGGVIPGSGSGDLEIRWHLISPGRGDYQIQEC